MRDAAMTASGNMLSKGTGQVDEAWADAMAMFPEEAEMIKERMDLARLVAGMNK